jgi:UDP:flavonoid glycosyltransferase YjiC (YdhE family)
MEAGIPQLIMPLSHDQPDNAHRIKRLGIGEFLNPKQYRTDAVANKLHHLLNDRSVQAACRTVQERFENVEPFTEACTIVESMIGRDLSE